MKCLLPTLALALFSIPAFANYALVSNGKAVECYGPDNMSFTLNAKRTTLKYVVEGETLGAQKVLKTVTDNSTYASYTSSEGTLKLSKKGDTFLFDGERVEETLKLDCK